ncbi:MAG: hypothetical protein QXE31_06200 [Candidatus Woesearchaeota archaeon]
MKNIEPLKKLTSKKHIFFTDRGNTSILLALKLSKSLGKKKIFIQDQGGWITYYQFADRLKLEKNYIETNYGIIEKKHLNILKNYVDESSVLLINSMPSYIALQNMALINDFCKEKKCFLINDASGSIGTNEAKYGDLILGSFGHWKPINIGYGGFIAFDNSSYETFFKENMKKEVKDFSKDLKEKLKLLKSKLKKIGKETNEIKEKLKDFEIVHKDSNGLNVVVKYRNEEEKLKIIDFCKLYNYEYVFCPMYIKILEPAISIEVMRKY